MIGKIMGELQVEQKKQKDIEALIICVTVTETFGTKFLFGILSSLDN